MLQRQDAGNNLHRRINGMAVSVMALKLAVDGAVTGKRSKWVLSIMDKFERALPIVKQKKNQRFD
ncbi:hypothetical protein [Photorhabdus namnaonensis]|uniref:hypothetical protein n=1 Tax=Photorhabdus namnaonensis TaxID=1851568 RepID=UPI0006982B32|nr:hypothetical protein [Photorhabdus namnaonensis]